MVSPSSPKMPGERALGRDTIDSYSEGWKTTTRSLTRLGPCLGSDPTFAMDRRPGTCSQHDPMVPSAASSSERPEPASTSAGGTGGKPLANAKIGAQD
ncbi:hypothetical protein CPLU01_10883 [Colletotrichum plurivorum]|uniref:Uncharacterized protein n=1 Tax=Colletotrichum plurivorum TaxID=2175906 RepID=A0A8H6N980_9PEZI|nr:hypothetical protein CPLU01_10883 [Colletotrichum plurivorum]